MMTKRSCVKLPDLPTVYAVERDDDGMILAALDVTSEVASDGLCGHLLATLPLVGRLDDVEYLNRAAETLVPVEIDCGNVHHLMRDLLDGERDYRAAVDAAALADAKAKRLKKAVDEHAARMHDLLARIANRKPLPLFEAR